MKKTEVTLSVDRYRDSYTATWSEWRTGKEIASFTANDFWGAKNAAYAWLDARRDLYVFVDTD